MDFDQLFFDLAGLEVGEILENEPMYKHTTFKVGGPARIFVNVKDIESLKKAVLFCKERQVKYMIIGKGSDLLFSDKEYEGVIFNLSKCLTEFSINGLEVTAQAGVSMIKLAYATAKAGLSGFEFMSGIPGTIGGGVYMNAGAYNSCFANVLVSAKVLDENCELLELSKEELEFGYRESILQKRRDWILVEAVFKLEANDPKEIMLVLDNRKERRMSSQPWNFASAGSVFRNPEGKAAWQYIDECGLRGYEIGGAQVSPKHSNFIVNNGYASARDVLDLILLVEKTVFYKFRVELKKEVILVNWE